MTKENNENDKITIEKMEAQLKKFQKNKKEKRKLKISEFIEDNKMLLTTGGAVTTAGAKAIAWIIENAEEIQEFINMLEPIFKSRSSSKGEDLDSLEIFGEPLKEALCNNEVLITEAKNLLSKKYGTEV